MGVSTLWLAATAAALVVGGACAPYVLAMLLTSDDAGAEGRPEPPKPNRPERPIPGEGRHDSG